MQSALLASNLMAVARESESIHVVMSALLQARAVGGSEHLMARCELSHACRLLTSRVAELRRIVTEVDREVAGTEVGSLVELGLRAQTAAILLVFDELYCALRHDPTRFADLYTGRLHNIEDVIGYVFDVLSRANRSWLRCRGELRAVDEGPVPKAMEASRTLVLCLAMRRAQRAIAALNADPDFAYFLRVGASRTDAPEVRLACDQLAQLLAFTRIRELDPELLLAPRSLNLSSSSISGAVGAPVPRPTGRRWPSRPPLVIYRSPMPWS